MPKIVNKEHRREEICGAAMRILARGGTSALTLRSLAEELNGSITLITHFFANRADLFSAIVDDLLANYDTEEWNENADPLDALRKRIEWFVPSNATDREREASRLALISLRSESEGIDHFYVAWEERARALFTSALRPIVAPEALPSAVDLLRVAVNGMTLSIVEHPAYWTRQRRSKVIDLIIQSVDTLSKSRQDSAA